MRVKYQLGSLCTQLLFALFDNKHQILCVCKQILLVIGLKVNSFQVEDYGEKVTPGKERNGKERRRVFLMTSGSEGCVFVRECVFERLWLVSTCPSSRISKGRGY